MKKAVESDTLSLWLAISAPRAVQLELYSQDNNASHGSLISLDGFQTDWKSLRGSG